MVPPHPEAAGIDPMDPPIYRCAGSMQQNLEQITNFASDRRRCVRRSGLLPPLPPLRVLPVAPSSAGLAF